MNNIAGLTIGITSSLIIILFVYTEINYDSFHRNADRIFRVYQHTMIEGEESFDAWSPVPMAAVLKSDYPEVQNVVRIYQSDNIYAIVNQKYFNIKHALYVDSSFFEIFSFNLLRGDKKRVLSEPHTVVLSESEATKLFGKEDPLDKMIRFENDTSYFRITGVSKDPPYNSHFDYDILISMDAFWDYHSDWWLRNNLNTYVLLRERTPFNSLEDKFPEMIRKYVAPQIEKLTGINMEQGFASKGNFLQYKLQRIRDIHLDTSINHGLKPSTSRKYIYIFSVIAFCIVLLAGINFVNLSTARSAERAHEVTINKILGSTAKRIIGQFLAESIILSIISIILAIILVLILLPSLNKITNLSLSLSEVNTPVLIVVFVAFVIFTGIVAGLYPAYLLSSFQINTQLKDMLKSGYKRSSLRRILVVIQFFIAIAILSCVLVLFRQIKFLLNKDLGFNKENILVVDRAYELENQLGPFMEEIKKYPGIINITNSSAIPGFQNADNAFMIEGRSQSETYVLQTAWVDSSFVGTYKMEITDGTDFTKNLSSDYTGAIINEAAVLKMGLKNPVGTILIMPLENGKLNYHRITGVVRDYHFLSLHQPIQPLIMILKPKESNWGGYLSIRLSDINKTNSVQAVEKTWEQFTNNRKMEYTFLDDNLKRLYDEEKKIGNLSVFFTVIAIFIACLGLFGLISFLSVKRTKEIGIRKIAGATFWNIVSLMSADTLKLVLISSLFAWPVAYFFIKNWLADFPYHIQMTASTFLLSTISVLILSMLTIAGRTFFAATRNPVDALRND